MHPIALKDRVILHFDKDVQIARWPAPQTGLTFAGQPDARASFHARRNVHRKRAFFFNAPGPAAIPAGILDRLAHPVTGWTGAFHRKKALLRPYFAHAVAGWAGHGFRTALGPAALADIAADRGGDIDGLLDALERFFQIHAQIIAQVRSALRARTPAATATLATHEVAKQILEHIRKRRCKIALSAIAGTPATTTAFKSRVAIAVIGRFLGVILQDVIGFVHFLELRLGLRIVGIAVRVQFFRLAAIGFLQLVSRRPFGGTQNIIKVTLCHSGHLFGTDKGRPASRPPRHRFTRYYLRLRFSPRSSKSASTMSSSTPRARSSS